MTDYKINVNNLVWVPSARRVNMNTARYAFVRNIEWEHLDAEHKAWHDARYDIVDNGEGTEQVLVRGAHYKAATLIVSALNLMAEHERVTKIKEEAPPPAA